MNHLQKALILLLICTGLSCGKDYNKYVPQSYSLNQALKELRSKAQEFDVQAGVATNITGEQGTILHFYPQSFQDKDGKIYVSGTVHIVLIEMYGPGDMVANNTSAEGDGKPIRSTGQINIIATMKGNPVYANRYGVSFKQVGTTSYPMQVYNGSNNNSDSTAVWTAADTSKPGTAVASSTGNMYTFDSVSHFGFVNGDYVMEIEKPNTDIEVTLGSFDFNLNNTTVYSIYNKSAWKMVYDSTRQCFHCKNLNFYMPVGKSVSIIAITNKIPEISGGEYYMGKKLQTGVVQNMRVALSMEKSTVPEVKATLNSQLE